MNKNPKKTILIVVAVISLLGGFIVAGGLKNKSVHPQSAGEDASATDSNGKESQSSSESIDQGKEDKQQKNYGVFIGIDSDEAAKLAGYDLVVIDAEYFTKEEVEQIKANGAKVYSYLNIGSMETFRDGFDDFKDIYLGAYENWEEESWVDVSQGKWQTFIAQAAQDLINKGIDGFWLDNADVYYFYPKEEIFKGLVTIIDDLKQHEKDILINGGDFFVTRAVLDASEPLVKIAGVNQETVFTAIDFDNNVLEIQEPEETKYYQDYLDKVKEKGLEAYLLEYADEGNPIRETIKEYALNKGFGYYVADSKELN